VPHESVAQILETWKTPFISIFPEEKSQLCLLETGALPRLQDLQRALMIDGSAVYLSARTLTGWPTVAIAHLWYADLSAS
jgi:hypothetical protein